MYLFRTEVIEVEGTIVKIVSGGKNLRLIRRGSSVKRIYSFFNFNVIYIYMCYKMIQVIECRTWNLKINTIGLFENLRDVKQLFCRYSIFSFSLFL